VSTAYLIGWIGIQKRGLQYLGADIFSESEPTQEGPRRIAVIMAEQSAPTFSEAAIRLVDEVRALAKTSSVWLAVLVQLEQQSRAAKTGLGGLRRRDR